MGKLFVTVRYDRMQNIEFKALCTSIMNYVKRYNAEEMHLHQTFARFEAQRNLLENLNYKQRKMSQSDDIILLRKRLDDMVNALMLNLKSLKHAQFDFQKEELKIVYEPTRNHFKKYIHQGVFTKDGLMKGLFKELKVSPEFYNAYQHLGLLKFTDAFATILEQITVLNDNRSEDKRKLPAVGITIPSKELITEELRFFLKSIEMTAKSHPEINYDLMVSFINIVLTDNRKQVRNLATRRVTAKAKLVLKSENENADPTQES